MQIRNSAPGLVLGLLILSGCGFQPPRPDTVVHTTRGHIPIACGAEPMVDKIHMRPVDNPRIVDVSGQKWVAISLPDYENLSRNVADLVTSYEQRYAQLQWNRGCIVEFNKRASPGESSQ